MMERNYIHDRRQIVLNHRLSLCTNQGETKTTFSRLRSIEFNSSLLDSMINPTINFLQTDLVVTSFDILLLNCALLKKCSKTINIKTGHWF